MPVEAAEARHSPPGGAIFDLRDHDGMKRAAETGAHRLRLAMSVERDADGCGVERPADDSSRPLVLADPREPLQQQPESVLAFRPFKAERAKPVGHGSNRRP